METVSKGKVILVYISSAISSVLLSLLFIQPIIWVTGPANQNGTGFIIFSGMETLIILGSVVGFFFCFAFAQLAFINRYWKMFWPVLILALLVALITDLIWFALAYAVVGGLAGWLWYRWRRR